MKKLIAVLIVVAAASLYGAELTDDNPKQAKAITKAVQKPRTTEERLDYLERRMSGLVDEIVRLRKVINWQSKQIKKLTAPAKSQNGDKETDEDKDEKFSFKDKAGEDFGESKTSSKSYPQTQKSLKNALKTRRDLHKKHKAIDAKRKEENAQKKAERAQRLKDMYYIDENGVKHLK